jgi:hypothetical protein
MTFLRLTVVGVLTLCLSGAALAQGASFTLDDEFDQGVLSSVQYDTYADQLQLSETSETKPYLYVANHFRGTVSKIDTNTGHEVARYTTCLNNVGNTNQCAQNHYYQDPQAPCVSSTRGHCPSRTAVDLNGDVWVANRAFGFYGSVTKIAGELGHCVDRNGNGVIETSQDLNGNHRIDLANDTNGSYGAIPFSDNGEWRGQADECVLFTKRVGANRAYPRGLTIDGDNNVWVGTYQDGKLYKLDNAGNLLQTISLGVNIYGLASDALGNIYNSEIYNGRIKQIDASTGAIKKTIDIPQSWPHYGSTYGIAVESDTQIVWLANWNNGGGVFRLDFTTGGYQYIRNPLWANAGNTRGVALDADGKVWVSNWSKNQLSVYNPATGQWEKNFTVDQGPIGVGIDSENRIWTANFTAANATRIDPSVANGAPLNSAKLGAYPYSYSDMTGYQLTQGVVKQGTWTVTHDSGIAGLEWGTVFWNENDGICPEGDCIPEGTEILVEMRAGDTYPVATQWMAVENGVGVSGVLGQYVEVKATLRVTGGADISPVLTDLRLEPANQPPVCVAGGAVSVTCTGGNVSVALSGAGSSDPDGDELSFTWSEGTCGALAPVFAGGALATATFESAGICGLECAFELTVGDGKSTSTCTQALTITDAPPTLSGVVDATVECNNGANGVLAADAQLAAFFAGPAGYDDCTASDLPVVNNAPAVFGLGATAVTFATTDYCQHIVSAAGTVAVADTAAPVAGFCPADDTLYLDEFSCTAGATYTATAADACVGALSTSATFDFSAPGEASGSYLFSDGNNNDSACATQTVVALDVTAPVVVDCPANAELVLDAFTCMASGYYMGVATDACTGNLTSDLSYDFVAPGEMTGLYTFVDGSGNAALCEQTVSAIDVTAPALECPADATLEVDGNCQAAATYTANAADACDGVLTDSNTFHFTYPGSQTSVYGVADASGNIAQCSQTVTAIDTIAPEVLCNAVETITPPDAPISFQATASDNCDTLTAVVTGYDCYKIKKDGSKQDKTGSCVVSLDGDTLTIADSGGVDDNILWTVTASDAAGNTTTVDCHVLVANPGNGGGSNANQGVGNGPEAADPGNSNQGDPANSNDENGGTPGNPGKKGGRK